MSANITIRSEYSFCLAFTPAIAYVRFVTDRIGHVGATVLRGPSAHPPTHQLSIHRPHSPLPRAFAIYWSSIISNRVDRVFLLRE
ncbi:uncharacterized protein LAJ45_08270 [Morchella importuna]|uniref:uncharacterized protein n=1 Tax=Morchella importuna TaxID=1174673 RepID=UPI001E8DBB64|nr:uncharacterized protein LAJ45_08270 [Morchella importuna]KAH8147804.1 hypothetical protein LAJ45_08270 [Morchella importuna]